MFSRSDKSDEAAVADVVTDPSPQRGPMVMAMLAGLLALAGAFLLVWYLNNGSEEVADSEAAAAEAANNRQVLVVDQTIPAGTSVQTIKDQSTFYLRARAVPADFVAASAITDIAQLDDLIELTLASEALPGEQLLRERFINRSDFDNEAFIERVTTVKAPEGHHQIVLTLAAERALGGNIRAGDEVTIVGGFRVDPAPTMLVNEETGEEELIDYAGDPYELSLVVLNTVEVLNVEAVGDVFFGTSSNDAELVGSANQGSFQVTLAVEPDELTDLTYAIEYGEITLAVAIPGTTNDDQPRAATRINEIIGDDGVWVNELEDGNLLNLFGLKVLKPGDEEFVVPEADETEDAGAVEATPASDSGPDTPAPGGEGEGEDAVGAGDGADDGAGES